MSQRLVERNLGDPWMVELALERLEKHLLSSHTQPMAPEQKVL
jgi:hypothetical protein